MHAGRRLAQPEIVINCDIGAAARDALKALAEKPPKTIKKQDVRR
ncbi:hypothetical protein [Bradyrhizobium elkanii]|nr:hypothetical protein [Bradyrhizobium elkanii]WLC11698.1 hypothetical protein QIH86_20740 [Bradyrhizobium elkanii USDA 94]